ncbi:MAG: ABC transporter permease [Acidimicrobiia bacterium]|nr:ABC transporter permease [Acidimicrobiia bacterium]
MDFLVEVLGDALEALFGFGDELRQVLGLTLVVSLLATVFGVVVGVPLGTWIALGRTRVRTAWLVAVNIGMGIPPVLAGLALLLVLWDTGPLGGFGLLFTPAAMVAAQTMLAIPIAAGVTAGAIKGLPPAASEQLAALALPGWERGRVMLVEVWPGVVAAVAAAFGRVVSEVGAVLVVGGNIVGETRVLTTAIVQETRQANFGDALALGLLLIILAAAVNGFLTWMQLRSGRHE